MDEEGLVYKSDANITKLEEKLSARELVIGQKSYGHIQSFFSTIMYMPASPHAFLQTVVPVDEQDVTVEVLTPFEE